MNRIRGIDELARELHKRDIDRAAKLRKARSLPKPKVGPRIAR